MSTFHDSIIKDGNGDIHFPRTDISSVRSVDGTKTLETIIEEEISAIGAIRSIDYGTCTTYSATATYVIGKLVIYNNRLYKCTTAIPVAEAWNAAHWTAIVDAQNGTVYNTTDSSFYGIRGADSVAKKLGSEPLIRVSANQQFVGSTTVMSWNINPAYTVVKPGKVIVTTSMSSNQRNGSSAVYKNGVLQTYKYICGSEGTSTANFLFTKTYEIEVNVGDIIRVDFYAGLWGNTSDGRATMWASYEVFTS